MKTFSTLLAGALLAAPAFAQCTKPRYAENDVPAYLSSTVTSGNLILAIQFTTPNFAIPALRLENFTGKSTGTTKLSLWDHDTQTGTPGKQLGIGSYTQSTTIGWQGANLDKPVVLLANTPYWIGLEYERDSQITASQRNQAGQPYRASRDGGKSWLNQYRNYDWKFRIYDCRRISPVFATFGNSCGPRGVAPQIVSSGTPAPGQIYNCDIQSTSQNAPVVLTLGISNAQYGPLKLPFDMTTLGATGCTLLCSIETTSAAVVNSKNTAVFPVQVPNSSSLVGVRYFHQGLLVASVANSFGIAFSNAAEIVIGQ